jgi:hypothetical protein
MAHFDSIVMLLQKQSDLGNIAIVQHIKWMQKLIKKVEQNAQDIPLPFPLEERREELKYKCTGSSQSHSLESDQLCSIFLPILNQ